MYCPRCGNYSGDTTARHCSNCGLSLVQPAPPAPGSRTALIAAFVVVALAVTGAGAWGIVTLLAPTPAALSAPVAAPTVSPSETTTPSAEPTTEEPTAPAELSDAELAAQWGGSVLRVETSGCGVDGSGSGFVIDESHVVTNHHVVATDPTPQLVTRDGQRFDGRVIGWTESPDVAVIAVQAALPAAFQWAAASELTEGQHLVGLGYPVPETVFSVTPASIVSFQVRDGVRQAIRADGALDRGNSGGPALTSEGRVAGVVTEMEANVNGFQLVPLLFTTDALRPTVESIIAAPKTVEAECGASVQELPGDWQDILDDLEPPIGYGDDDALDDLYDQCGQGNLDSCDELYLLSPYGSDYEEFASTCGGTSEPSYGVCSWNAEWDPEVAPEEPAAPDLSAEREACLAGDNAACDDLWFRAPPGSEDEEIASTCGGRSEPTYGTCAFQESLPSVTEEVAEPDLAELRDGCAAGDGDACNTLYWEAEPVSEDETFASTCGGRSEPTFGNC